MLGVCVAPCGAVCVCVRPVLDVDEIYVERCGGVWMCVVV